MYRSLIKVRSPLMWFWSLSTCDPLPNNARNKSTFTLSLYIDSVEKHSSCVNAPEMPDNSGTEDTGMTLLALMMSLPL